MKKVSLFLVMFLLGVVVRGYSQTTTSTDFFAGKWEITVVGLPDGDTKFITDLSRKDGKLTGELKDTAGAKPAVKITKVEEQATKMIIHFDSDQAGDIPIELAKVDYTHLKGQLYNMFDATAVRINP